MKYTTPPKTCGKGNHGNSEKAVTSKAKGLKRPAPKFRGLG